MEHIKALQMENVSLVDRVDRIATPDLYALVDSPSVGASLKDGYAVLSREVADAAAEKPVRLRLLGYMAAGDEKDTQVKPGTTVRVLTGARIPTGADPVASEEFVKEVDGHVLVGTFAEPGRNQYLKDKIIF